MEPFASATGPLWPGFAGIEKFIIFGDSYSSVGYSPRSPHPSLQEPLGIRFPGLTWTEGGDEDFGDSPNPNWVGHLVTSRRNDHAGKPILVYDYAVGGQTVPGVLHQIDNLFLPHVGSKPTWAPWTSEDSLFVIWVGINDCAYGSKFENTMDRLFGGLETLYDAGARNFLLIDVPPIERTPAISDALLASRPSIAKPYRDWNNVLHARAAVFHASPERKGCSILMFSSFATFDRITTKPAEYGFPAGDVKRRGGSMWMDHLHPTSKTHKVLADDIERFLKSFPPYTSVEGQL